MPTPRGPIQGMDFPLFTQTCRVRARQGAHASSAIFCGTLPTQLCLKDPLRWLLALIEVSHGHSRILVLGYGLIIRWGLVAASQGGLSARSQSDQTRVQGLDRLL